MYIFLFIVSSAGKFFRVNSRNARLINWVNKFMIKTPGHLQVASFCLYYVFLKGKTLWSHFMIEFKYLRAGEPLWGDNLLLTTLSPGIPITHLINHGRLKGCVVLESRNSRLGTQCSWPLGHCFWTFVSFVTFFLSFITSFEHLVTQLSVVPTNI